MSIKGKSDQGSNIPSFKTQNNMNNHSCSVGLVSFRQVFKFFETHYDNVKHFNVCFILVIPLNLEVHAKICKIEVGPPYVYTNLFYKL